MKLNEMSEEELAAWCQVPASKQFVHMIARKFATLFGDLTEGGILRAYHQIRCGSNHQLEYEIHVIYNPTIDYLCIRGRTVKRYDVLFVALRGEAELVPGTWLHIFEEMRRKVHETLDTPVNIEDIILSKKGDNNAKKEN